MKEEIVTELLKAIDSAFYLSPDQRSNRVERINLADLQERMLPLYELICGSAEFELASPAETQGAIQRFRKLYLQVSQSLFTGDAMRILTEFRDLARAILEKVSPLIGEYIEACWQSTYA